MIVSVSCRQRQVERYQSGAMLPTANNTPQRKLFGAVSPCASDDKVAARTQGAAHKSLGGFPAADNLLLLG